MLDPFLCVFEQIGWDNVAGNQGDRSRGPRRDSGQGKPGAGREPDRERANNRPAGDRKVYSRRADEPREERRTITAVPEGNLPRWVREDISRSTPKDRRDAALHHLEEGIGRFADGRYRAAIEDLAAVKALSPRAAIVRELLGLSNYYLENWSPALQELRAYRRLTGETIHMPVELDCLRALRKGNDVDKTFTLFRELGGDKDTEREAAVVYASHLLDEGRVAEAWRVIKPGRLVNPAPESERRRWFVAARVALAAGDKEAAGKLVDAINRQDSSMPGLADLKSQIR